MIKKLFAVVALLATAASAQAVPTASYAGINTQVSNCYPFGCPDSFGGHVTFVYKNIDAFALQAGDVIAFDTGLKNDTTLSLKLSLAATTANGTNTASAAGFTQVASLGSSVFGNNVVGDYDIAFVLTEAFNFAGGGLMIDFVNTNGAVVDNTYEQNLVWSTDNPYTVGRYYSGTTAGTGYFDTNYTGNFQVVKASAPTQAVPEPESLALLGLGFMGLMFARRRARSV